MDNGPENEELDGLHILDRKRLRGGPDKYDVMDTPGGLANISSSGLNNTINYVILSATD